jgi:hypothetical protein
VIELRPMSVRAANELVRRWHSHHKPVQGARWCIGAYVDGDQVGAVIVGNPVAPALCDGKTLEVTRLVTNGEKNVATRLLGGAWRAAKAMGCKRLVSYTRQDESGHCYLAASWKPVARTKGRGWDSGNKQLRWLPGIYEPTTEIVDRTRWEISNG